MITVSQIREHLQSLLDSNDPSSLDEFEDWLVRASWNMHQDTDLAAQEFASSIELRLVEFSSGDQDESVLRKDILKLLNEYSVPTLGTLQPA
jgi:hypothetical protein